MFLGEAGASVLGTGGVAHFTAAALPVGENLYAGDLVLVSTTPVVMGISLPISFSMSGLVAMLMLANPQSLGLWPSISACGEPARLARALGLGLVRAKTS